MSIGAAAAGASKSLKELLAERFLREQFAAQQQQQAAEQAQAQARLALQAQQEARMAASEQADQQYRTGQVARQGRLDDVADAERRQEGNARGVQQMIGGLVQREGVTPANRKQIVGMLSEIGKMPSDDLLKDPEAERQAELKDYEEKRKIDARYNRAQSAPEQAWVKRGGKIVPIAKGTAQPGDEPYDAVAARQTSDEAGVSQYTIDTVNRTIKAVDEVLPDITNQTAGVGSILRHVPGTKAANVSADLSAVAANVAFQALQAMREASKTGGALGQISERELDLLSAVEGSIRQNQSPTNLKKNLLLIRESMARVKAQAEKPTAMPSGPVTVNPNAATEYNWVNGQLVPVTP